MPKILVFSDVHLSPNHPERTRTLVRFLADLGPSCDEIYCIGDLFEYYLNDKITPLATELCAHLSALKSAGTKIFFIAGNRDFLYKDKIFTHLPQCSVINTNCGPIALLHGDTLVNDNGYLALRSVLNSSIAQLLFLLTPNIFKKMLAERMRKSSKARTAKKSADKLCASADKIAELTNASIVIHGHFHNASKKRIADKTVFCLGEWLGNSGSYIEIEDTIQLKTYTVTDSR